MKLWSEKFAAIIVTLWVGALWAVGYLAVPSLFHTLHGNAYLAGALAGNMFTLVAYVGMASAAYLIVHYFFRHGLAAFQQWAFWLVLLMLILTLAGHFGVQPVLAQIKAQGMQGDIMNTVFRDRFAAWHGVASIAYLIQSLLGLMLVVKSR